MFKLTQEEKEALTFEQFILALDGIWRVALITLAPVMYWLVFAWIAKTFPDTL